jgi:hypothetical protein
LKPKSVEHLGRLGARGKGKTQGKWFINVGFQVMHLGQVPWRTLPGNLKQEAVLLERRLERPERFAGGPREQQT